VRLVCNSQRFFDWDNPAILTVRIDQADFLGADGSIYPVFRCTDLLQLLWRYLPSIAFCKGGAHHTIRLARESISLPV